MSRYPRHQQAEEAVLGSVLLLGSVPDAVRETLGSTEVFYEDRDKLLYQAALDLTDASRVVDFVSLRAYFDQRRWPVDPEHWSALLDATPSAARVEHYAEIVRDRALRRSIVRAAEKAIEIAAHSTGDASEAADECESVIMAATQARDSARRRPPEHIAAITPRVWDEIVERAATGQAVGIPTGFYDLDRELVGLEAGSLSIIAARPGMGKTALVTGIAERVAEQGLVVLLCSLEMPKEAIVRRMFSSSSGVSLQRIRRGDLTLDDLNRLSVSRQAIERLPLVIDDQGALTLGQVRARARRVIRSQGRLDLLIVDYLQIMGAEQGRRGDTRDREVARLSAGLKATAKELGIPVIALSQLNRAVENRQDRHPTMADLRDSGAIEQDADNIVFVYRHEVYDTSAPKGVAELVIGKNRNGRCCSVNVGFDGKRTRFFNLATRREEEEDCDATL